MAIGWLKELQSAVVRCQQRFQQTNKYRLFVFTFGSVFHRKFRIGSRSGEGFTRCAAIVSSPADGNSNSPPVQSPGRKRSWGQTFENLIVIRKFVSIMTYQVEILNPKADKLLQNLADLKLISLSRTSPDPFMAVVKRLRKKATAKPPTLEEITKEVETVRSKRYANESKA